jgi:uncharacterized protein
LNGLASHPLREVLVFKGGTALRRCWFKDYRFSEDLDFTLTCAIALEDILSGLAEIFASALLICDLQKCVLNSKLSWHFDSVLSQA